MRIAVWHNLPSGGGKRALYDHVRGLVGRGHHVEVWCPPSTDTEFLPLDALAPVHYVPLQSDGPSKLSERLLLTAAAERRIAWMDAHCRACADAINASGFDILFANSCQLYRTTSIGRFSAIPAVLYLQEPYRWLYEALPTLPWVAPPRRTTTIPHLHHLKAALRDMRANRDNRVQAREEVNNAFAFDRILVNSNFSRESVLRAYGLDAEVCYLGVDPDHFRNLGLVREDFVVGLGAVIEAKNLPLCIQAVAKLSRPRPKLTWIANYANDVCLRDNRALALELDVDLEVLLGIEGPDVVELLNRATAMLYAPRLEPFGLAPLEANACGLPVIAVAEGGVRETMIDGVNALIVPHDSSAMARAIDRLRTDAALARRLGEVGRKAVEEQWSIAASNDRIEQALIRVVEVGRPKVGSTADVLAEA